VVRDLAYVMDEATGGDRAIDAQPLVVPGVERGRAVRVGVISNPRSWRNLQRDTRQAIQATLAGHATEHFEEDTFDGLVSRTQDLIRQGSELIVVNGGDGTVQAALTGLFNRPAGTPQPLLALLSGGTTNTTAHSLGYGQGLAPELEELLARAAAGCLRGTMVRHAVLRADFGLPRPMYAMLFGAGGVFHGINFYRTQVETRGFRGEKGAGLALAIFVGKVMSGKGGTLFPPLHMAVRLDDRRIARDAYFGVLASTMDRQFLGLRPYWGQGPGTVRFSSMSYSPRHVLRAVGSIVRGRPSPCLRPEFGFRSDNAFELELEIDSGFTLDGELFTDVPRILLSGRQRAFFLRRGTE